MGDSVNRALAGAILLAVALSLAARAGLQSLYVGSVAQPFGAAQPSVHAVAEAAVAAQPGEAPDGATREWLAASAASGVEALAPLVGRPRLRGTFLEPVDAPVFRAARGAARELGALAAVLEERQGPTQVAYRLDRVLARAAASDGWLVADPAAARAARRLWLRSYADEFLRLDAELRQPLDELAQGRAGGWDPLERLAGRTRQQLERTRDRLRALPVPPEALPALQEYALALAPADRAARALGRYAESRGVEALGQSDEELAASRPRLAAAAARIARLAGQPGR